MKNQAKIQIGSGAESAEVTAMAFIEDAGQDIPSKRGRELLLSEGSLTLKLEELFGTVSVDYCLTSFGTIGGADAELLRTEKGEEAMKRVVCLGVGGAGGSDETKLIYAETVIPLSTMDDGLAGELEEGVEPLGRILYSRGILFKKERLQLGLVRHGEANELFHLDPSTVLFQRSYKLIGENGGESGVRSDEGGDVKSGAIKASVIEIFSPYAMGAQGGIENAPRGEEGEERSSLSV